MLKRYIKHKLAPLYFCLIITSCVQEIQKPDNTDIKIIDFIVDYDQTNNEIFLQVNTEFENQEITMVSVEIFSEDNLFDTLFVLNDAADNGDLISSNGTYSGLFYLMLSFQSYQLNSKVITETDVEIIKSKTLHVEEQFAPEINSIIFYKKNIDNTYYEFNPDNEPFLIDDSNYVFLDIQLEIMDKNGLEDIDFVRYQINVENMVAEDSCDYIPVSGYQSFPQWYLDFQNSTDSTFIFDINNDYLEEPGIPVKPISLCGRTGITLFKFIVSDQNSNPVAIEQPLLFAKCGDGFWNCDEDCESCLIECGECE